MKLVFNNKIEISRLKEISDIASFVTNAQCISDEVEIFSTSKNLSEKKSSDKHNYEDSQLFHKNL